MKKFIYGLIAGIIFKKLYLYKIKQLKKWQNYVQNMPLNLVI